MDVIDRLNEGMKELKRMNVEIRFENMQGVTGGLCQVGNRRILMVEVTMSSSEQLELFESTIKALRTEQKQVA